MSKMQTQRLIGRAAPLTEGRFVSNVLKQNVERLQQLDADKARSATFLAHYVQEVGQHVLFQKEATGRNAKKVKSINP